MNDIHVPQDERGEGRQARQLVGRELEMGRIRAVPCRRPDRRWSPARDWRARCRQDRPHERRI